MHAAVYYGNRQARDRRRPRTKARRGRSRSRSAATGSAAPTCTSITTGRSSSRPQPHPLTGKAMPLVDGPRVLRDRDRGRRRRDRVERGRSGRRSSRSTDAATAPRAGPASTTSAPQIGFHGLMSDGGMAEYTVVPTIMLHRLPDNVPLELGALVEPMSVAYHAATLGDVRPGDRDGLRRRSDRDRPVVRVARHGPQDVSWSNPHRPAAPRSRHSAHHAGPDRHRRTAVHRRPHQRRRRRRGVRRGRCAARGRRQHWPASASADRWSASRSTRSP